jgi:FMN reductase
LDQMNDSSVGPPSSTVKQPHIVGVGGTIKSGSNTELALHAILGAARGLGATTTLVTGVELAQLPLYAPDSGVRTSSQRRFVDLIRQADGLVLATPSYHAGVSGLIKNALDLLEDLREDVRPYLDGRAVGCVVVGAGMQGPGATLTSVRTIIHALRGWPTPLGLTLNSSEPLFDANGQPLDARTRDQMRIVASQVVSFAERIARRPVGADGASSAVRAPLDRALVGD